MLKQLKKKQKKRYILYYNLQYSHLLFQVSLSYSQYGTEMNVLPLDGLDPHLDPTRCVCVCVCICVYVCVCVCVSQYTHTYSQREREMLIYSEVIIVTFTTTMIYTTTTTTTITTTTTTNNNNGVCYFRLLSLHCKLFPNFTYCVQQFSGGGKKFSS